MRPVQSLRILVGILFILTALSPIMAIYNPNDNPFDSSVDNETNSEDQFGNRILKDSKDNRMQARGQPCPALTFQNDAGQQGDAGNDTTGPRDIGNNPTDSFIGCVDQADTEDWYEFTVDANNNVDVELSNFDFDYDILLGIENKSDPGNYICVDCQGGVTYDPVEKVTTFGSPNESEAGTYVILIYPWDPANGDQGDYQIDIWTNYTETCSDWYSTQNDGNTGQDAPQNWTDSPTNMGNNVTDTYTGCVDSAEEGDVFAFDVPVNHTIDARLTLESGHDIDLILHQPNGTIIDASVIDQGNNPTILEELVSSSGTSFEDQPGTYFVNVSNWAGSGNYTLDVWTNASVPTPNLAIENITFNRLANPGDTIPVDVEVINDGTLDLSDSFMVEVILSVDLGYTWVDHNIGNATWSSGIAINATQIVTVNGAIPTNIVEGEYNVFAVLDSDEMVLEKDEFDNSARAEDTLNVGNSVSACATPQEDAGSGSDVGDFISTAFDLGTDPELEVRGCVDSNDNNDMYKVTISASQPLNVTLVSAPIDGVDFDMQLLLSDGTVIDSSLTPSSDEFVSLEGTDYEGSADVYYINITYFEGTGTAPNPGGTYRLLVGEPDQSAYVPPFSCGTQNDLGLNGDASSASPGNLGTIGDTGSHSGSGCIGGGDSEDVFEFNMGDDYKNIQVSFNAATDLPFTAVLQNSNGDNVASADNTTYGLMFDSLGEESYEGQDEAYKLIVYANGGEGTYDVDLVVTEPALPDLVPQTLNCPTEDLNSEGNNQTVISWTFNNIRGPGFGQDVVVLIELVDSDNVTVATIYSSEVESQNPSVTSDLSYNFTTVQDTYKVYTVPAETSTGDYRCKLIIDSNDNLEESDETNNIHFSDVFYIQNEAELYANDPDKDGYNTTDTGDGNIDDCPDQRGFSTIDRVGCLDLDGDGVSNDNDILITDPSQWYDTDGDGFGDNSSGTNGDQCPDVFGVADVDGPGSQHERGCPIPDTDEDGVLDFNEDGTVLDKCSNTAAGVEVDADGCEVVDDTGDNQTDNTGNVTDSNDNTGDTTTDPTDPSANTGSGDDTSDASDKTESDSGLFGMSYTVIGIIGGVIVLLLGTLLFVRGRGSKSDTFAMQEKAYADAGYAAVAGMGAVDTSITPEQLEYEQQLIAAGYPADYARAYADQHFRPWLNQ
mgnify:CR=1 FL=1